jgi:class 3 adenylate cyclase
MEIPDARYARADDGAYIAYQVVGDGPVDIAWQPAFDANIDASWADTWDRVWFTGLASFCRLILHDRRAVGSSSRNVPAPNLETRASDLRAVLDAAGSDRAVLGGWFEALAPAILLAATDPDRVRALVWWNPIPRTTWAPDYPWGQGPLEVEEERRGLAAWGTIEYGRTWARWMEQANGVVPPEEAIRVLARTTRTSCTPDVAIELQRIWWETDIRGILPSVQAPTLLVYGEGEGSNPERTAYVASLLPNAEIVSFPHAEWVGGERANEDLAKPVLEAIRRFIGVEPARIGLDSILSTVLFTDIIGSTAKQAEMGDHAWKELLEHHHALVRDALGAWNGVEKDTAGDGFFATFDGPARAIRCALEVVERVRDLGLEIRAGVHTGECELIDGKVGGISVTTGARIASVAGPSEVLISQTVKDLVAGSGVQFEDAGEHDLKGVPDRWHLHRAITG